MSVAQCIPTLLHAPRCNFGECEGVPSSCVLLGSYAIGAWVLLYAFSALTLLVGLAHKKLEWWGTGVVIRLEWGANELHMVLPLPCHHLCFKKLAYPGSPAKKAVKWLLLSLLNGILLLWQHTHLIHCVSIKNTPNIFHCNSNRRCWILIILGRNAL